MMSAVEQFRAAIRSRSLVPQEIIGDGKLRRCEIEGRNGRSKDGAYILFDDGPIPAGGFQNHADGLGWQDWRADVGRTLTLEEERAHRAKVEALRAEREAEDAKRKAEAQERAAAIWNAAEAATDKHPYLVRKGVRAHGVRVHKGALVVALFDTARQLHSLQFIGIDGEKRFLTSGRVQGCLFPIGKLNDGVLCIAEGYATAASIHEATGHAVAVAFNAGNLEAVARALRAKYPDVCLILCADDDYRTEGNPGLSKATEAARAVNGLVAFPEFDGNRPEGGSDFNDLHQAAGLGAIRACIEQAKAPSAKEKDQAEQPRATGRGNGNPTKQSEGAKKADDTKGWPDPQDLPPILPTAPAMPEYFLPESLRGHAKDVAERMQVPLEFVGVPLMVALGFLTGRKVAILPKRHDNWLVVPNLWGATVGRPGVLKSPAQEKATDPVERLEIRQRDEFKRQEQFREAGREVLDLRIKDMKKQIERAIKNGCEVKDLQKALADLNAEKEEASSETPPTYVVSDTTVEKLQEIMATNPGGLLLARDELAGLFATFEKSGREGDREFYLEAWSGTQSYRVDRIGRGSIYIERNRLSIIGSTQPGKIQKHVQRALDGGSGDDGLLQRFQLVVWPEVPETWEKVDRWENLPAKEAAFQVFKNIDDLEPKAIGATQDQYDIMPALRFSPDGQEIFDEWFSNLERRLRTRELKQSPAFESHLAKYRSLMPSLALVFHVVDVVSGKVQGLVSREAALRAITWCEYLEQHIRKVYAEELGGEILSVHALAEKIRTRTVTDGNSLRDIWLNGWSNLGSSEKVAVALRILEQHGWVREEKLKSGAKGGRPSMVVRINPKLHFDG
jgi:putative DNA primase/helicase